MLAVKSLNTKLTSEPAWGKWPKGRESGYTMEIRKKEYAIGIDIGGTKCAVVLGRRPVPDESGETPILDKRCFSTGKCVGWKEAVDKMAELTEELLARNGLCALDLAGIGISCGGPLKHREGVIMNPPNLVGWSNVPIAAILRERFGVPVCLENDANAGAVAECRFGRARGKDNVVFLTFGTGLGAGLILNGRLYRGTSDMAGEVGHIRLSRFGPVGYGKAGSFEGFCSGSGIVQLARSRLLEERQTGNLLDDTRWNSQEDITAEKLAAAAREGDEFALSVYHISARYLGKGLAIIIDMLNPEMIIIGSIFERCEDLFREEMCQVIEQEALKNSNSVCQVAAASLGDQIGDFAALAVAFGCDGI